MPGWRNGSRGALKMLCREACGFDSRTRHVYMKVKELVEKLLQLDQELDVVHGDHGRWYYDSSYVRIAHVIDGREDEEGDLVVAIESL